MKKLLILFLFVLGIHIVHAQQMTVTGTVTDASNDEPLVGVTVLAVDSKGTPLKGGGGATTDIDGVYTIKVDAKASLRFSYIGMSNSLVKVNGKSQINVAMQPTTNMLDEVVVTALGINREARSLNYSRQAVDAEAIADNNNGNLVSSLSGKIAGVSITPAGVANGSSRIVIRGTSSLTENSQPVFVVDGMILENNPGDGGVTVDGGDGSIDLGNPVSDINPEDIESIEILKGPNAAALYGSRAAQGVVLITTKKSGNYGRAKITYNGNFQFEKIYQFMDYQNGWGTGENNYKLDHKLALAQNGDRKTTDIPNFAGFNSSAGAKLRSWGAPLWDQVIYGHDGELTTHSSHPDNVRDFYSTAHRYSNTLTIEGGSKENNYRVSYTHTNGNSVVHGINESNRDIFNVRISNTLFKGATLDTKGTYSYEKVKNRQYTNGSNKNPIYAFVTLPRDLAIPVLKHYKDEAGKEMIPIGERGFNPYWNIYENTNADTRHRFSGTMRLEIEILRGLKAVGKAGVDAFWWQGSEFYNPGARSDLDGGMKNWNNNSATTNFEGMLMYNNRFGKLSLNAMIGMSQYQRNYEKRTQELSSVLIGGFDNISNSDEYPIVSQNKYKKIIRSGFGSLSLGWSNYLYLDITARNDWSSTLPSNNNSYFYPSFGGSFVFTDAFKINPTVLSFGKLRASYAYAGADTDPYRISQSYGLGYIYNGSPLQVINTTLNNEWLKPERTKSLEIGAEFKFFGNRLGLDLNYYKSDSYDLITRIALPASSGYTYRYMNTGHIRNRGWEAVLTATPVATRNFTWSTTVNWSLNRSKVIKVADGNPNVQLRKVSNVSIMLEEGMPYGILRGREWKRDEQGRKLVDANGKPLVSDNTAYLGNAEPKWRGSFGSTLRYKDFSLSFLLEGKFGGVLYSGTWYRATTAGVVAESAEGRESYYLSNIIYGESDNFLTGGIKWDDAYYEDGTKCERYVKPNNRYGSWDERCVFDASYIKLREVSIGYRVPRSFLKKLRIVRDARLSFVGRNLAILYQNTPHGIDPEAATSSGNAQGIEYGSLPPTASFGFDINVSF